MKLITFCSFKGGAGKTTALMGICSALHLQGKKVALFEADENRPLTRWKTNAERYKTWQPSCEVFIADELQLLERAYEKAQQNGFDYALVDTQGGSSELNNTIIASSNFLLVPTMLTPLDVDEALATYRYIIELLMSESLVVPTALLRQRVPVGKLTASQRTVWEAIDNLPLVDYPMYERDAFAAMKERGMLHMTISNTQNNSAMRLVLRNLETAMEELLVLGQYVEGAVADR
ncbi:conjugal transfer ATPase VirC1 [Brucella sp. NBRC 12950]|jgi:cellulose biosynthesis protein BcsQ|uniref:conjugal transfer ATPase VirC1 n=1 Tax=Brucella sp. NBRC 12950 TaxID=2994518 RepID=UPI0024A57F4B|nr:conjugal transfer ATPase VirC1 [Brucella sp. NBRC 12950]GLU27966.1 protein virC1 [Brucella sp. NBRC 12950]